MIAISAWFRDRPSVSSKSGKSPWMGIMISFSSLIVAYMYLLYALNANSGRFCFLSHRGVRLGNKPLPLKFLHRHQSEHLRLQKYLKFSIEKECIEYVEMNSVCYVLNKLFQFDLLFSLVSRPLINSSRGLANPNPPHNIVHNFLLIYKYFSLSQSSTQLTTTNLHLFTSPLLFTS